MQAENAEICRRLRSQLGKSHDMARTLLRIKKVKGSLPTAYMICWCVRLIKLGYGPEGREGGVSRNYC